jgi:DNA-directed RNA polymerase subunit RPC12/RpoP
MATIKCTKCETKIENVTNGVIECPNCKHKMRYVQKNPNINVQSNKDTNKTEQKVINTKGNTKKKEDNKKNNTKNTLSGCISLIAIIILIVSIFGKGCNTNDEKSYRSDERIPHKENMYGTNDKENIKIDATPENFVSEVKNVISDAIGEDEFILDVHLENNELCVYVDISNVNTPISIQDLAISRTSSITDHILALSGYDDLWETITVDFGEIGKITNNKSNIGNNITGRYFYSENFILE